MGSRTAGVMAVAEEAAREMDKRVSWEF